MINFVVALVMVGMPITFFMIFADMASPILVDIGIDEESFWSSKEFTIIVLAVLLFYFNIQKRISEMKIAGIGLFAGVIIFVIILAVKIITGD